MKTDDQNIRGHVIDCYDHDQHRVVVTQSNDAPKAYHFFYIPQTPEVNFGDIVEMNLAEEKFFVYRGNSRLTFSLSPTPFPGNLLLEIMSEYL